MSDDARPPQLRSRKYPTFGTDGVRGVANSELTAQWAVSLGRAAARVLGPSQGFVIGRDTRISGSMIASAFSAGVASEGLDVVDLGVVTTPGVAWVAQNRGIPGAVISASHNVFSDNGVKLFGAGGTKLSDSEQTSIEDAMGHIGDVSGNDLSAFQGKDCGTIVPDTAGIGAYVEHLCSSSEGRTLDGLTVVLDCANGAASRLAPEIFSSMGAQVFSIGDQPNGTNINEGCGSTDLAGLTREVKLRGADLGIAFDGDADRALAIDERGEGVDGDQMIALFAVDMADRGKLESSAVVVTIMTNLGFHQAMKRNGIEVVETDVGDRNVLVAMENGGISLGGEQSGHIIFRRFATTGDGILTGLHLMDLMARRKQPLSQLASQVMMRLPQQLVSVTVSDVGSLAAAFEVWEEAERVSQELGSQGRVLIRPSGTEPKVRVMVEASTHESAVGYARRLSAVVESCLG